MSLADELLSDYTTRFMEAAEMLIQLEERVNKLHNLRDGESWDQSRDIYKALSKAYQVAYGAFEIQQEELVSVWKELDQFLSSYNS